MLTRLSSIQLPVALALALSLIAAPAALASQPASVSDIAIFVTAQRFEHGTMIYRTDTGGIWVLYDDGYAASYPSWAYGGLPDNPFFSVPPGFIRPINGFGRLWGGYGVVRNKLGWALRPEFGYTSRIITQDRTVFVSEYDQKIIQISPNDTWRYVSSVPNPPPDLDPSVDAFSVTPDPVNAGDTITISWAVSGTETVLVEVYNSAGDGIAFFDRLPLTGEVYVSVPATEDHSVRVVVWGANLPHFYVPVTMYEHVVSAEAVIAVTRYPSETGYTQAAYQSYEHGFMIWRADTGAVLAFVGSQGGQMYTFAETTYGALPDNPYSDAPAGLIAPIRGFGKVWGGFPTVRDQLGWATGPEQSYDMTIEDFGGEVAYLLPEGREAVVTWQNFWSLK
jgi:hypothetical protein